ncbi:MAG: hypothetical protein OXC66_09110 [Roseovarius sp.]|nr:hypothetical protein [Roseovarius sp.]
MSEPIKNAKNTEAILQHKSVKLSSIGKKFLIFDTDLCKNTQALEKAKTRASDLGIKLFKQKICFESFLLRHFEGCENVNPSTSDDAERKLKRIWPECKKNTSAMDLGKRLQFEHVLRASKSRQNKDIAELLKEIGLYK